MTPQEFANSEFDRMDKSLARESGKFDDIIILISTGTLALSANYVISAKDIQFSDPKLLIASWIFFLAVIFAQGLAYMYTKLCGKSYLEDLRKWKEGGFILAFIASSKTDKFHDRAVWLTDWSFYFLIAGLIIITIFVTINFLRLQGVA